MMSDLPEPIAFSVAEGENIYSWPNRKHLRSEDGLRFHALWFSDGSCFDMANGWRSKGWASATSKFELEVTMACGDAELARK